ncbi:Vitellogenin 1, partial [Caligus rogercresseyi]
ERTLHGDCETTYTLHPLPLFQAHELEEQWRVHKTKVWETIPGYFGSVGSQKELDTILHQGEAACTGKQYYQVIKTHNFDNCRERPLYYSWTGIKNNCDTSKSGCEDAFSAVASTRYIICGEPSLFIIRKATTENIISLSPAGFTPQKRSSPGLPSP